MYNGPPKPNLRRNWKVLTGLEGLLEIMGLEVMAEGIRLLIFFCVLPEPQNHMLYNAF